jgi:4-hydroxybenzoate polyprenyltransferase
MATAAVIFFGYANFVLAGYFKDLSADRATGYMTLPVRFGLRTSALVSDGLAVATVGGTGLTLSALLTPLGLRAVGPLILAGAGTAALVLAQVRLHRVRDESEAHRAIVPVVHAYLLLLSALVATSKPDWMVLLLMGYGAFVLRITESPDGDADLTCSCYLIRRPAGAGPQRDGPR